MLFSGVEKLAWAKFSHVRYVILQASGPGKVCLPSKCEWWAGVLFQWRSMWKIVISPLEIHPQHSKCTEYVCDFHLLCFGKFDESFKFCMWVIKVRFTSVWPRAQYQHCFEITRKLSIIEKLKTKLYLLISCLMYLLFSVNLNLNDLFKLCVARQIKANFCENGLKWNGWSYFFKPFMCVHANLKLTSTHFHRAFAQLKKHNQWVPLKLVVLHTYCSTNYQLSYVISLCCRQN